MPVFRCGGSKIDSVSSPQKYDSTKLRSLYNMPTPWLISCDQAAVIAWWHVSMHQTAQHSAIKFAPVSRCQSMLWGFMELAAEPQHDTMLLHQLVKVTPAAGRQHQIKLLRL